MNAEHPFRAALRAEAMAQGLVLDRRAVVANLECVAMLHRIQRRKYLLAGAATGFVCGFLAEAILL